MHGGRGNERGNLEHEHGMSELRLHTYLKHRCRPAFIPEDLPLFMVSVSFVRRVLRTKQVVLLMEVITRPKKKKKMKKEKKEKRTSIRSG